MRPALLLLVFSLTFSNSLFAARIDTLTIYSEAMQKSINNLVVTPTKYKKKGKPYPVLYLLHGTGGDYALWVEGIPKVVEYADEYGIILVFPDGGKTSWYFDSPIEEHMKYETYIASELIKSVDENYNTATDKNHRAITGFSMGGHGAFYLAIKHSDIWGAAGSMSGGLDITLYSKNGGIARRLGPYAENKDRWSQNSVINMVESLSADELSLIIDCGIDDFFFNDNRRVHDKLLELKIPHDYIERPGGHTKAYWANALDYQVLFFVQFFKANTY